MQQKELKELVDNNQVDNVMVVDKGVHWEVCVNDKNGEFAVIRTARGGKREFKTLDAVKKMLKEVNVKFFSVC